MPFLHYRNPVCRTHPQHQRHQTPTIKNSNHKQHASTENTQTSTCISWTHWILQETYQELCQDGQAFDTLNLQTSKIWVDTTPSQHLFDTKGISYSSTYTTLSRSNEALHSTHRYIRQCLWSTTIMKTWWNGIPYSFSFTYIHRHAKEMEHHRTRNLWCILCSHKRNYYLQGAEVIIHNNHKPLAWFLNGKNANNKVNRWGLELATYSITFKWIAGAHNKATDCLSRLVELPQDRQAIVQMLSATNFDGPAFNTRSRTAQCNTTDDPTPQPQSDAVTPDVTDTPSSTLKPLTTDRLWTLLQMQRTDPFCKHISKCLSNGKASKHEADLSLHVKVLLYKHVTDSNQKCLALVIPKAWKYTVLVEAHDKLGHQGATHAYCLIKCQYYWKGMKKDVRKYIANCTLCHREKAKVQSYPLQMTEILEWPFDKIAIDLVWSQNVKLSNQA